MSASDSSGKRKRASAGDYFSPTSSNHETPQRRYSEVGNMRADSSPPRGPRQSRNHSPSYSRIRDDQYSARSADRQYSGSTRYDDRDRRRSNSPERHPRQRLRSPELSNNNTRSSYSNYRPSYGDKGPPAQTRDRLDTTRDSPRRRSTHDDHSTSHTPQSVSGPPSNSLDNVASHSHPPENADIDSRARHADMASHVDKASTTEDADPSNLAVTALADILAELTKQTTKQVIISLEHESAKKKLEEHQLEKRKSDSYYPAYPGLAEQKKASLARAEKAYESVSQKLHSVEIEMAKTATLFATKVVKSNLGIESGAGAVEPLQARCSQLEKAYQNLKAENEEQKKELSDCKEDCKKLRAASDALQAASETQKTNIKSMQDKVSEYIPNRFEAMEKSLQQVYTLVDGPQSTLQQLRGISDNHSKGLEILQSSITNLQSGHDAIVKSTETTTSEFKQTLEPLQGLPEELGQINKELADFKETLQQQAIKLSDHAQISAQQDEKLAYQGDSLTNLVHTTNGAGNGGSLQNLVLASLDNEHKFHHKFTELQTSIAVMEESLNSLAQEKQYLPDLSEAQSGFQAKLDGLEEKLGLLEKGITNANLRDVDLPNNGTQSNPPPGNTTKEPSSILLEQKVANLEKQTRAWVSDADTEKEALAMQIQGLKDTLTNFKEKSRPNGDYASVSAEVTKLAQKCDETNRERRVEITAIENLLDSFDNRVSSLETTLEEVQRAQEALPKDRHGNAIDEARDNNAGPASISDDAILDVKIKINDLEQRTAEGINSITPRLARIETDLYHPMNNFGTRMTQLQNDIEGLSMSYNNLDGRINGINTRDLANHIFSVVDQNYPQMKDIDNRFNQLRVGLEEVRAQVKEPGNLSQQRPANSRPIQETRTMNTNSLREQSLGPSRKEMDDFTNQLILLRRSVLEIRKEIAQVKEGSLSTRKIRSNLPHEAVTSRPGFGSRQPSLQRSESESSARRRVMSGTPTVGSNQKVSSNLTNGAQDEEESHPDVSPGEDSDEDNTRPQLSRNQTR